MYSDAVLRAGHIDTKSREWNSDSMLQLRLAVIPRAFCFVVLVVEGQPRQSNGISIDSYRLTVSHMFDVRNDTFRVSLNTELT